MAQLIPDDLDWAAYAADNELNLCKRLVADGVEGQAHVDERHEAVAYGEDRTHRPQRANLFGLRAQAFDDAEVARRVEHVVVPSNEQNLDRLSAEVLGGA